MVWGEERDLYILTKNSVGQVPITYDYANVTCKLVRELSGGTSVDTPTNGLETVDAVNCPGLYKLRATKDETKCRSIMLTGESSTVGVNVVSFPPVITEEYMDRLNNIVDKINNKVSVNIRQILDRINSLETKVGRMKDGR